MIIQQTNRKTLHLVIHGHVQGVFFRESMRVEAAGLAITGWVRNRGDGTVEAMVQGDAAAVDALVDWARHGPSMASVERLDIEQGEGSFSSFEVIRSS
jgi:acylphosphatase